MSYFYMQLIFPHGIKFLQFAWQRTSACWDRCLHPFDHTKTKQII